jgi:hypothetical protein
MDAPEDVIDRHVLRWKGKIAADNEIRRRDQEDLDKQMKELERLRSGW